MLSGAANISRGWPAIHTLQLASDRKIRSQPPSEIAGQDVVLSAVEHPPRIGETRPIAALLPDVLARYGLTPLDSAIGNMSSKGNSTGIDAQTSIDVSV